MGLNIYQIVQAVEEAMPDFLDNELPSLCTERTPESLFYQSGRHDYQSCW